MLRLLFLLLLALPIAADVPQPVRASDFDYRCVDADGETVSNHRRHNDAVYACQIQAQENVGQSFFIETARYRVSVDATPRTEAAAQRESAGPVKVASARSSAPASSDYPYFEQLVAHPNHHSNAHLRTQQNVLDNLHFSRKNRATTYYDAEHDAARFIHKPGWGSIVGGDQVRHPFPVVNDGTVLIYWASKMDKSWSANGDVFGLETQKAFQISRGDDLALEPRHRYAKANKPRKAWLDVRTYVGVNRRGPADAVAPQVGNFYTYPERWTYYWFFIDVDNKELSYWVSDEEQPVKQILRRAGFDGSRGWTHFWMEFNSSQSRRGPEAYAWGRNIVTLRNLSYAEAQELVRAR